MAIDPGTILKTRQGKNKVCDKLKIEQRLEPKNYKNGASRVPDISALRSLAGVIEYSATDRE